MPISIDLGATHIRIANVSGKKITNKKIVDTPKTKAKIKQALINLIKQYKKDTICICLAAFLKNGKVIGTSNMDLVGVDIKKFLSRFKSPVFIENDANCAGLAELYYGNGRGHKNFLLLTLGTGIGGAVIIDKKIYKGTSFAGEIGQMILDGELFENIASGRASINQARKAGFKNITEKELESLVHKGNKKALKIYKRIGKYLGIGILNASYILDPEIVIIGGGFSKSRHIYSTTRETVHKNDKIKRNIKIVRAKLGDEAGLIGAALLAKQK